MTARPDYPYWALRELWEVRDAACLLLGIHPGSVISVPLLLKFNTLMDIARDAMDCGTLKPFDRSENHKELEHRRVRPTDFLIWWQGKGLNIPKELAHLLSTPVSEGPNPAEENSKDTASSNKPGKATDPNLTTTESGKHRPGDLKVVVDDVNQAVTVFQKAGNQNANKFSRSDIVGKGTVTWDLLVAFAKCGGSLEANTAADVKTLNTSVNRKNLSEKLVGAMNLIGSPIVEGKNGVMCFQSIQLAGDKSSPDAMERGIITGDDQGTKYLESHGFHMPPIDTD